MLIAMVSRIFEEKSCKYSWLYTLQSFIQQPWPFAGASLFSQVKISVENHSVPVFASYFPQFIGLLLAIELSIGI